MCAWKLWLLKPVLSCRSSRTLYRTLIFLLHLTSDYEKCEWLDFECLSLSVCPVLWPLLSNVRREDYGILVSFNYLKSVIRSLYLCTYVSSRPALKPCILPTSFLRHTHFVESFLAVLLDKKMCKLWWLSYLWICVGEYIMSLTDARCCLFEDLFERG